MPLYAYIKIPGVENSESKDASYGNAWIPLISIEFAGTSSGTNKTRPGQNAEDGYGLVELFKEPKQRRQNKNVYGLVELFSEPENSEPEKKEPKIKKTDNLSSGGITITKMMDSTTPKLHLKCLQCSRYKSDQYIEGKVELHICRQIPGEGDGPATNEVYMAYIMEKCLITRVKVEASESLKLNETVHISFEKISSCIKTGSTWDSKAWDFIDEKEDAAATPSEP
jgi:type VI protein secretion system component Hcp